MRVRQLLDEYPDASFVEVYRGRKFHTDYCEFVDDWFPILDEEAKDWELMDRAEYQSTILANSGENVNLIVDFDKGDALIILLWEK